MNLAISFKAFLSVLSDASIINSYFTLSDISKNDFKFSLMINSLSSSFISSSNKGFLPLDFLRSISTDPVSSNFSSIL